MKTIIVTGGLGFIGSNLIELLLKKNFYVINLDKDTERLEKVKEECDKFNIKFQRFPGINPLDLSKNILNKYVPKDIQEILNMNS